MPWPQESDSGLEQSLLTSLRQIRFSANRHRELELTDAALDRFSKWYRRRDTSTDEFRATFESREDAHVLRLAGCLSVSDGSWLIEAHHINDAIRIIQECKDDGATIFEGAFTSDKLVRGVDRIRQTLLESESAIVTGELYKSVRSFMSHHQFKYCMAIMHELGMVEKLDYRPTGRGRPTVMYRKTKYTRARNLIDTLNRRVVNQS